MFQWNFQSSDFKIFYSYTSPNSVVAMKESISRDNIFRDNARLEFFYIFNKEAYCEL